MAVGWYPRRNNLTPSSDFCSRKGLRLSCSSCVIGISKGRRLPGVEMGSKTRDILDYLFLSPNYLHPN